MNLIFSKKAIITVSYKFYSKSSRKLLTSRHYFFGKHILRRNQNTHLMFVRAPKHFKAGKQIIVFFNSIYRKKWILNTQQPTSWVYINNPQVTFNILNLIYKQKLNNDIVTSRISIETDFYLFFNGRYNIYTINN